MTRIPLLIAVAFVGIYAMYAAQGIYPGDAGDIVTAAVTAGVPHPPGFPLYTFIGHIVSSAPFGTPAWRMAWLSVLPHAVTLAFVYLITLRLAKSRIAALFSVLLLGGNYLFFLYSTTPEVFALLDMFVAILIFVSLLLHNRFNLKLLVFLCVLFGLSLAHHPFIVLVIPSVYFFLIRAAKQQKISMRVWLSCGAAACAGFLPYVYVVIAARGSSIINWDRAVTISRFVRLVTRADYGQFMSGSTVGHSMVERLLNVKIYATFFIVDYTWIGVVLAGIGLIWLWKRTRAVAWAFAAGVFFTGPAFAFYASFPTVNRFVLGTVERFMLPSYVFLTILVGIGMVAVSRMIAKLYVKMRALTGNERIVAGLCSIVFFVYPITTFGMTLWRFGGLSHDKTAEQFAMHLIESAPQHSIVLLVRDTPLFTGQYLRYAKGVRSDLIVLHTARMFSPDYHEVLSIVFPQLVMPDRSSEEEYLISFIRANADQRPITSNEPQPVVGGYVWIPHGLLYRLIPEHQVVDTASIVEDNSSLWESYDIPGNSMLYRYHHLFLTNVLDEYALRAIATGKYLLRNAFYDEAEQLFGKAASYGSDTQTPEAFMYQGLSLSLLGRCDEALNAYDAAAETPYYDTSPALMYYRGITLYDCVGDYNRAEKYFERFRQLEKQSDVPLELP